MPYEIKQMILDYLYIPLGPRRLPLGNIPRYVSDMYEVKLFPSDHEFLIECIAINKQYQQSTSPILQEIRQLRPNGSRRFSRPVVFRANSRLAYLRNAIVDCNCVHMLQILSAIEKSSIKRGIILDPAASHLNMSRDTKENHLRYMYAKIRIDLRIDNASRIRPR